MTLLLLADAVVPSRAQSPFRNSPVLLIMMVIRATVCFASIKKPSVWLTLNCLSLLEVSVCLHPTRVAKIARRRERMCKKKRLDVHFLLKLEFIDLRAAKHSHTKSSHVHLKENSVISDYFQHWIVLFFWACMLGVLQLHVIESLLVFVYVCVLFPMIHPFIPFLGR